MNKKFLIRVVVAEDEERILNNITKKINQTNTDFEVIGKSEDW